MSAFALDSLAGARPRHRDDVHLPGLVGTIGPWRGPTLARAIAAQDGFGVAVFKAYEGFLELIVTDYRDGSNANVFASENELTVFPGFTASARFLEELLGAVAAVTTLRAIRDFKPTSVSLADLV